MKRCPTCHQPIPDATALPIRVCRLCHQPIMRHDKWRFVFIGDGGVTAVEHRHCDNPESYMPREVAV